MDWLSGISTGILSGVIASFVFIIAIKLVRPKIEIASEISVYPDNQGNDVLRVKIVNRRFRAVSDLSVQMYIEHEKSVHGGKVKVRRPIGGKFTSHTQIGRKFFNNDWDNARRIIINRDQFISGLVHKPDGYLVAEVFAKDAVSGVGAVFSKKYALGLDKCVYGSYIVGNGTKIEKKNDGQNQLPRLLEEAKSAAKAKASTTG